jgi:hypothetical protein
VEAQKTSYHEKAKGRVAAQPFHHSQPVGARPMSDFQNEAQAQIYGRLSAHEFMLEILWSQFFAQMSQEQAVKFAAEVEKRMKRAWIAEDVDPRAPEGAALQVALDAQVMATRFLKKALDRANEIRGQLFPS